MTHAHSGINSGCGHVTSTASSTTPTRYAHLTTAPPCLRIYLMSVFFFFLDTNKSKGALKSEMKLTERRSVIMLQTEAAEKVNFEMDYAVKIQ